MSGLSMRANAHQSGKRRTGKKRSLHESIPLPPTPARIEFGRSYFKNNGLHWRWRKQLLGARQ
jgi:hypothetical protein